jgi:hypothetical protein
MVSAGTRPRRSRSGAADGDAGAESTDQHRQHDPHQHADESDDHRHDLMIGSAPAGIRA